MKLRLYAAVLFALSALMMLPVGSSLAQHSGTSAHDLRIEQDKSLSDAERESMHAHLRACTELGLADAQLDVLFPQHETQYSAAARLRMQERVIEMAGEGLSVDLVCDKIGEGMMKHAPEPQVERAAQRMGDYVGEAHHYMESAREDGVSGLGDPVAEQHLERGLAMNMWRGLHHDELDDLRTRARERMQDGDCTLTDVAAAAETVTELKEIGVDDGLAMSLCGDALAEGYTAEHMRGMGHMAMYADMNGESGTEFCERLHEQVQAHAGFEHMQGTMMHSGWMGPESMDHGYGGCSPVDDVMGGGHHNGDGGHHSGDGGGMGGHNDGMGGHN